MRLNTENVGTWFDVPNDPDNARVCLRAATMGVIKEIHKKTSSKKTEYKKFGRRANYQRFEYDDPDEDKREQLLWDYCIVDWEGFFDTDAEMECSTANKIKLMNESAEFALFVADSLEILNDAQIKDQEDIEKN